MIELVIVLIVALVILAVVINSIQQHKEKVESEKRAELTKQRMIIDESEELLLAAGQLPISKELSMIIHQRLLSALEICKEINPSMLEVGQRIKDTRERIDALQTQTGSGESIAEQVTIPENDKQIILVLQGLKKLRSLLRNENAKGKVDTHLFMTEDKRLARAQLTINVETMIKRGRHAMENGMLGSARQYFEKANRSLSEQVEADEYVTARKQLVEESLYHIKDNLRSTNRPRPADTNDDLDELFAPKKKW